jgi:hypothetical protein
VKRLALALALIVATSGTAMAWLHSTGVNAVVAPTTTTDVCIFTGAWQWYGQLSCSTSSTTIVVQNSPLMNFAGLGGL